MKSYLKVKLQEIRKYYPDWEYSEIGIGTDHVHLHMIIPPKYSVSKVVETIKANTSRALRSRFGFLGKVYWDDRVWLVYKPRLAAEVAKLMAEEERDEYCAGGSDNKTFVCDTILDQLVAMGLCNGTVDRIRGRRDKDQREGDFYRFPRINIKGDLRAAGAVVEF